MARSRETIFHKDWTGGLRVSPNMRDVGENQVADVLDMDFGYEGGFILRGGFQSQLNNDAFNGGYFLCPTYFASDVYLIVDADGGLYQWDGAVLTATGETLSDSSLEQNPVRGQASRSRLTAAGFVLIVNGREAGQIISQKWDGATLTTLGNEFNDDYNSLSTENMPAARLIAEHNGYMWVADTVEGGVRYPHRIRFSHLYSPTDWATDDFFDVGSRVEDSGDPITAVVPFGSALLVFKRTGVYAVYGYGRDDFFVEQITTVSGVSSPDQVATSPSRCYWYSNDGQVLWFNGQNVEELTDSFRWWAESGIIKSNGHHILMWAQERLFMSFEGSSGADEDRYLLVFDPRINALTRYSPIVRGMAAWQKLDSIDDALFLFQDWSAVFRFDHRYSMDLDSALLDTDGSPLLDANGDVIQGPESGPRPIHGHVRTGWFTAGETATKKRWKRPRVTAGAQTQATIHVGVYHDFDSVTEIKSSDIVIAPDADVSLWDVMEWDTDDWEEDSAVQYGFSRLSSSGGARAVQFTFDCTNNVGKWWVDSIAIPFRRKQVR